MTEEIWKSIKDFSGYEVSNQGRIRSKKRSAPWQPVFKILKSTIDKNGYPKITLFKQRKTFFFRIHRLVLEAFIGSCPSGHEANHKDGIKVNNEYGNLEWTTSGENIAHAFQIGLRTHKGMMHPNAKLKDNEIWLMKKLLIKNVSRKLVSKIFKVSESYVSNIVRGCCWSHIKYEGEGNDL